MRYSVQFTPEAASTAVRVTSFPTVPFETAEVVSGGRASTNTVASRVDSQPPRSTRSQIRGGPSPVRSVAPNHSGVVGRMYVLSETTFGEPIEIMVEGRSYTPTTTGAGLFVSFSSGTMWS